MTMEHNNEIILSIRDRFEKLASELSVSEIVKLFVDDKYLSTWTLVRASDTGFVATTVIDGRTYRVRFMQGFTTHISVGWYEI